MNKFNEFGLKDDAWYQHCESGEIESGKYWNERYLHAVKLDCVEEENWSVDHFDEVATIEIIRDWIA